jgi:thiol:disulfide interchange protein DsbD
MRRFTRIMSRKRIQYLLCSVLLGWTWPLAVSAAADSIKTENVTARLVSERIALEPGATAWVALQLEIRPGWHTYWINPGDAGEKTALTWRLPPGFVAGDIHWPAPGRLVEGPVTIYGYQDRATHLVPITVPATARAGERVSLAAEATWLVCEKICIPESGSFELILPVGEREAPLDERWIETFERARNELPKPAPWPASFSRSGNALELRLAGAKVDRNAVTDIWFYPYAHGVVPYAAPQSVREQGKDLLLSVEAGKKLDSLATVEGVLVVRERLARGEVTHAFALGGPLIASSATANGMSLALALLFALLGGILLNAMPCVFPVLSIKVLSFAAHADSGRMARHGWAYTAGVAICFLAIGALLLALRAMGGEIGWGFQLQEPMFVLLMAYLMLALGLNLSGLFSIGGSLMGSGGSLVRRDGLSGSFFTGLLAVVVATPCTAPFMGAALGYGLTQPAPVALAVLFALGLGMALPFLVLSASPALLRHLPRPGPWMERFRQFLAFPMYATAAWLVWILSIQAGDSALLAALAGAVLLAMALWFWEIGKAAAGRARRFGLACAILALAGTGALAGWSERFARAPAAQASIEDRRWIAFSAPKLGELRDAGVPVFVNFTAAWCVTCVVNEKVALRSELVWAAFKKKGVVAMKADWTRRDPAISRALAEFGRSGVPLYVIYAPQRAAQQPILLPEILTESIVLDAIALLPDARTAERPAE